MAKAWSAASLDVVAVPAGSPVGDPAAVSPPSSRKKLARDPESNPKTAIPVIMMATAANRPVGTWIRTRYMDTPFLQAAFQVVVGGVLVFVAGIVIGSS